MGGPGGCTLMGGPGGCTLMGGPGGCTLTGGPGGCTLMDHGCKQKLEKSPCTSFSGLRLGQQVTFHLPAAMLADDP